MRIINKYILGLVILIVFHACKKDEAATLPYSTYGIGDKQGQLKIVYASAYNANPSVILKINGATVSNSLLGRTPFPGGGYNTLGSSYALYLSVPQGNDTIAVVRPKIGTNIDSVVFYKTVINIPDNSAYTLHITDTLVNATTNNTTSVLIKNDLSAVDTGKARYRFVNLIPNVPGTNGAVDLYLNGVKLDSNVAYKQAGKIFTIRIGANAPGVTDPNVIPIPSWVVRPAGSPVVTTNIIATYNVAAAVNTLLSQRAYTIFAMGYFGITTGTTRIPYVSFTLDKNN